MRTILTDYDSYYGNTMSEIHAQLEKCGGAEALCRELDDELDEVQEPHDYAALAAWCRDLAG